MRKRTIIGIAVTLAAAASLAFGSAANAATPGLPYDNTDPSSTGCSADATTIASYPIKRTDDNTTVGTLNVRYSATCGTNWVQVNNTLANTWADKYIDRIPDYVNYYFDSDYTADYGAGYSYGMQIGAPGCIHVWANIATGSDNTGIIAMSGTHTVC